MVLIPLLQFLSSVLLIIFISAFLNVFLHELGHAIPLIFLTKEKIGIYIGSLGDDSNCLKLRISRLTIYVKQNPLIWKRGVCKSSGINLSVNKQILYIATGPVMSLAVTIVTFCLIFSHKYEGYLLFSLYVNFLFGVTFSYASLVVKRGSRYSPVGRPFFNDLMKILHLRQFRKYPNEYTQALKLITEKKYSEAETVFAGINGSTQNKEILRFVASISLLAKNYSKAEKIMLSVFDKNEGNAGDFINFGVLKSHQADYEGAMNNYRKALQMEPKNIYALNNIGFTLSTVFGKHDEAFEYLNLSISLANKFAHSYYNRGYAKIKTGDLEGGRADIEYSLQLDDNNSYGYRNLGVYYLAKRDFAEAKSLFLKAKSMDESTYNIDYYLGISDG